MTATTGPAKRTAAAHAARRNTSAAAMQRVHDAIARLRHSKTPVSFAVVARRANVSRTFLYTDHDARSQVQAAIGQSQQHQASLGIALDEQQEATWRERALNAEDALKAANTEILSQRSRIGELMGQIRDLQAEWSDETIQHITTENTTLKQRIRQLAQDNRTLEERLQAARSTLRFQDRRLADLEIQLLGPQGIPESLRLIKTRSAEADSPG